MIKSVRLKNFKLFREADIPLERLTVFVGPNSSGKTTVLEATYGLTQLPVLSLDKLLLGRLLPSNIKTRGSQEPVSLAYETSSSSNDPVSVGFRIWNEPVTDSSPSSTGWRLMPTGFGPAGQSIFIREHEGRIELPQLPLWWGDLRTFHAVAEPARLFRLDPRQMLEPVRNGNLQIEENGRGLCATLQSMMLGDPDRFRELQERMEGIIPGLQRIRMEPKKVNTIQDIFIPGETDLDAMLSHKAVLPQQMYRPIFDMAGASDIAGESASDGVMLALCILTVLSDVDRPRLVLLDDIDRGFHPKACGSLIDVLRKILKQRSDLQIIATSHSPYLLDHLGYDEVRITSLDKQGTAHVGRLSDHPDFDRWKDVMSPGEFWSSVGEKWLVANGKPANA
jgi:AAA domain, putative AbiEii toxin, Type IV TA system/AAA ATPase domain